MHWRWIYKAVPTNTMLKAKEVRAQIMINDSISTYLLNGQIKSVILSQDRSPTGKGKSKDWERLQMEFSESNENTLFPDLDNNPEPLFTDNSLLIHSDLCIFLYVLQ